MQPSAAQSAYAAFVAGQLAQHEATRVSIDGRAINVVVSSSAIASLLLALAAFARVNASRPGPIAAALVEMGVVFFAIAAIEALRCIRPHDYRGPTVEGLRQIPSKYMDDTAEQALAMIIHTQLTMLHEAKRSNAVKAERLDRAILLEVAGAVALAIAVGISLVGG